MENKIKDRIERLEEFKIMNEVESNKQVAIVAIVSVALSLLFNNYAPMIVFICGWIDHFYEFVLIKKVE